MGVKLAKYSLSNDYIFKLTAMGKSPFLVVGSWKIRSPLWKALINIFTFFNASSLTCTVILIFSVLVWESSSLHLGVFHPWLTEYSSVRSDCFSDTVTMMPNSTAVIRSSRLYIFFNEHPAYLPSADFPCLSS